MATEPERPDNQHDEAGLSRSESGNALRTAGGALNAGLGLVAAAVRWIIHKVSSPSPATQEKSAETRDVTGDFVDISGQIFNSSVEIYRALIATKMPQFRQAVLSLLKQIDGEDVSYLRDVFSDDQYVITDSVLARLVARFRGFEYESTPTPKREFIPILDVLVEDDFFVSFETGVGQIRSASFKVKIVGIGGTGACVFRREINASFGPYGRSCQLQMPVQFTWSKWVRPATGEALHILKVIPEQVGNPKLTTDDDPDYKKIDVARDAQVAFINKVGGAETTIRHTVKKDFSSKFDCDVGDLVGIGSEKIAINIESTSESSMVMEISYNKTGQSGHLYAPALDAVLFRAGP